MTDKVGSFVHVALVDAAGSVQAATGGSTSDEAWDGSASDASVVSLLKAIYNQLAIIATNTVPAV